MAGTGVGKFSSTAGNNTSNMTTNFAENMAPSNVNNAARELMGHIYDMYKQLGDGYFEFGDGDATYTVARSDADTITITSSSDISSIYFPGRKIRITDGGANVVEGTIASSSHSSTTQTVNLTGISLASGTPTKVELGIDTAAFGGRIILDDDGDTYIEAPTDDTIDIYVAGAKDFVITANTFTAESGSTIAAQALTATTGAFTDNVTITTADNTDTLTLTSTDADASVGPNLRLYRNSSSPEDGNQLAKIDFEGRNDNSQDVSYFDITAYTRDVSDGEEDGILLINGIKAGSSVEYIRIDPHSSHNGIVFNDGSTDMDFRVESNGNANTLFVNGGTDRVGVGTNAPAQTMHIRSTGNPSNDTGLILEGNATDSNVALYFYNSAGSERGRFLYDTDDNNLTVKVNTSEVMRFHSGGNVSIGTTSDDGKFNIATSDSTAGPNSDADELFIESNGNAGLTIGSSTSASGNIHFADNGAANRGILTYDHSADQMKFGVAGSIRARFTSSGEFLAGKSSSGIANTGVELHTDKLSATVSNATVMYLNRLLGDGKIAQFHQAGSEEGSIEVSGSTVSYNGFTGSHWSRLADNSKPTILRGTIMDSIDEMCDWYQAVAEVPEVLWSTDDPETQDTLWTEDDTLPEGVEVGDVKWSATATVGDIKEEAYTIKESITLGDKSVGDSITFTSNTKTGDGKEYTGTIVKEDDVKHTKSKVSDTADSKKVYGVFSHWDDADDGLDGDVNDMNIAQVGTYVIRINADEVVEAGDLLVSNGDGTAKVQDDDIIRSKTVAKVNSTVKIETYADGSYTVPCTLHC